MYRVWRFSGYIVFNKRLGGVISHTTLCSTQKHNRARRDPACVQSEALLLHLLHRRRSYMCETSCAVEVTYV